jgi:hypothetical protein
VALRKEANFCCPVPDCSNFILTYHHFDPPWSEKQHNNPVGMIALCPKCHNLADGGRWTKAELRGMKANPKPLAYFHETIGFPEPGRRPIFRLGGNYFLTTKNILAVADRVLLWEESTPEGQYGLSLDLFDETNQSILAIRANSLEANLELVCDCSFSPQGKTLVVRRKKREVALKLVVRRITLLELQKMYREESGALQARPSGLLPAIDPNFWRPIKDKCSDTDGRICLIDIVRANLHANGRWFGIRDGFEIGRNNRFRGNFSLNCESGHSFSGHPVFLKHFKKELSELTFDDALIISREYLLASSANQDMKLAKLYKDAWKIKPELMNQAAKRIKEDGLEGT